MHNGCIIFREFIGPVLGASLTQFTDFQTSSVVSENSPVRVCIYYTSFTHSYLDKSSLHRYI